MNRYFLLGLLLVFTLSSCRQKPLAGPPPAPRPTLVDGRYNVAFLIMDGTFTTEFTAPFDIFQHTV